MATKIQKPVTPGVVVNERTAPLSSVRTGAETRAGKLLPGTTQTAFNPNQDLQRAEMAYKATLPVVTADKAKNDLLNKQGVLNQTNQQLTTQAEKNASTSISRIRASPSFIAP